MAFALTNLDYHLGQSKYGDAFVSDEESFHGSNAAKLSVECEGNYIRMSIYMDEPQALDDLNHFSMWMNPQSGNAKVQLELFLDGDGDNAYDSDSASDVRLRSLQESWSDLGMTQSQWNELDGFSLEYEKYGDKNFSSGSLDDCAKKLSENNVVKLYITIYKDKNVPNTSSFLDYIQFGGEVISFESLEEDDIKNGPKSVSQGGQITYTITYGNNNLEPVDLVVMEDYDPRTIFLEADPAPEPGTNNVWTFKNLPPGAHGQIVIKMKTTKPACKGKIEGEVTGNGYSSVRGFLSTNTEGYRVINHVYITSGNYNFTASATTAVRPIEGSTLIYGEHGSGFYHAKDKFTYSASRIYADREINCNKSPVWVNLPCHPLLLDCSWSANLQAENRIRDILWSDQYLQNSLLNMSTEVELGKSFSLVKTSSHFVGMEDRETRWLYNEADRLLLGNFTIQDSAKWRQHNKTVSAVKDNELNCCPLIQGYLESETVWR